MAKKPVVLIIRDGWGVNPGGQNTAVQDGNATLLAKTPFHATLFKSYPRGHLSASGLDVGLPPGQMGNSEVGHLNLGAGRVVYQDLTRINKAIAEGTLAENPVFKDALAKAKSSRLHFIGLVSDGGVHSHQDQLTAMVKLAKNAGVHDIFIHAITDGRDTSPTGGEAYIAKVEDEAAKCGARVATVIGRYFAMDRDQRWDRLRRAWDAVVDAQAEQHAPDALTALAAAYARGENDEFVAPTVIGAGTPMHDGDAIVFMNFRADRARQLTAAFVDPAFEGFDHRVRRPTLSRFVCLSEYDARLPAPLAFTTDNLHNTLGDILAANGLTQLRIAETEKYAHVTFFFSGGREDSYAGEERILVPSPKVATYDLQPEMSCPELTAKLVDAIASGRFDVIVCNIANPDMVGHTGDLQAAILAAQAVDIAIGAVDAAVRAAGGALLVTADHGNLEMMRDPETGQPHTAHTVGPVPFVYAGDRADIRLRSGGALRDVAPTILDLLGLPQPAEMSGRSLLAAA